MTSNKISSLYVNGRINFFCCLLMYNPKLLAKIIGLYINICVWHSDFLEVGIEIHNKGFPGKGEIKSFYLGRRQNYRRFSFLVQTMWTFQAGILDTKLYTGGREIRGRQFAILPRRHWWHAEKRERTYTITTLVICGHLQLHELMAFQCVPAYQRPPLFVPRVLHDNFVTLPDKQVEEFFTCTSTLGLPTDTPSFISLWSVQPVDAADKNTIKRMWQVCKNQAAELQRRHRSART